MNSGPHVLVVSRDQMLLQTRSLILGTYFQVQAAGRVPEAELAMSRVDFDLVVLCHSLYDDEYAKLLELVASQKRRPKVLTLNNSINVIARREGDGDFAIDHGPYQLLRKAAEMVGFQLKPMGRTAKAEAAATPPAES